MPEHPLQRIALPVNLLEMATTDPLIRDAIHSWKVGNWTWDEMLLTLVCVLVNQRDSLARQLLPEPVNLIVITDKDGNTWVEERP